MRALDWLFVPRRWRNVCVGAGMYDLVSGTHALFTNNNLGWVHIAGAVFWFSYALREHEKMTK